MVELLRLGIVLLLTAAGYAIGGGVDDVLELGSLETTRLVTSVLGALFGYVLGGAAGRAVVHQVDTAAERLQRVPASTLIASCLGAAVGGLVGIVVLLPVLLLPAQAVTVPIALLVVLALTYAGARLGALRGSDLARFIGLRGRLEVSAPSRGGGVKLLDSSALVDGRLVEVARAGFLEGSVVIPTFVLDELRTLADSSDASVRRRGRRALDLVVVLQDEQLVAIEITEDDDASVVDVDAKLASLARSRRASLVTCDSGLARVAEIAGVRVLNVHTLAEAVRPPVIPGDRLTVRPLKAGREPGQGVAYLDDGTMVVVDGAADDLDQDVEVDVTSIVSGRRGRMLFGVRRDAS
jgi:uncharacterized protein YacL